MSPNKNNPNITNLEFHLESQDYFGTLATILNLLYEEKKILEERHKEIIDKLVKELTYLQQQYKITKK